jgi:type I restriction-modification system DNA methylase subunit
MSLAEFQNRLNDLIATAEIMLAEPRAGKPEENTKDRLIEPLLDVLGYGSEYRTLEGSIRSLLGTTTWVDYFLRQEAGRHPKLMLEAKSLWEKNIWANNEQQVLDYLRNYSLDIGTQEPVLWLILSNFREWHILRLQDRKPFWSFTLEDLKNNPELIDRFYDCLNRENLRRDRLEAVYNEKNREELGVKFLGDLKIWRLIIANGIQKSQPQLGLDQIREAAQVILNRFLLIRLLETFSREMPFNYLGRVYYNWQQNFPDLPFIEDLRRVFHHTWVGYNTELFQTSWIDQLMIEVEYLESIIVINAVPREGILYNLTGTLASYRSIYNYDFTTLTQDILGTAYEQFLAHQLMMTAEGIKILENQQTRKQEGIFYTPDYIVRCIVYQTLEPLVKPIIDRAIAALEAGDFQQAYQVACAVFEIKIIDPACGSGSFLLGAFDYLLGEIKRYNQACQKVPIPNNFELFKHTYAQSIINAEEQILVKMLHGVDRDPQAVLLAKLSLWTKLLRSRPGEYGRRNGSLYSHLPALSLNIRTGDSLIHSPANLETFSEQLIRAADLAETARESDRPEIERNQAVSHLEQLIAEINHQINPVLTAFFASEDSLTSLIRLIKHREAQDKELELIRSLITEAIAVENVENWARKNLADWTMGELARVKSELMVLETALEEVVIKRPFNWQVEFPHVFDRRLRGSQRGFTVVLGNPPYFNVDATFGRGAAELKWLKFAYPDIYTDKTDILFYFFRRGYDLLKETGYLSFIISRSFIQGDKSAKLREFLSQNTKINGIIDFLGYRVFNAGIATCIFSFAKQTISEQEYSFPVNYVINFDAVKSALNSVNSLTTLSENAVNKIEVKQHNLGLTRWNISPYHHIFTLIDSHGTKLRELPICDIVEQGIQTGDNEVFVPEGGFPDDFSNQKLYRVVKNSGIFAYGFIPEKLQLLYIENGENFDGLPQAIQQYLLAHKLPLESRAAYKEGSCDWYALHRSRRKNEHFHFRPKILCPYRASHNRFSVDLTGNLAGLTDTTAIFLRDVYQYDPNNLKLNRLYALVALLNSKVLEFRYRALGGLGKLTSRGMFEYFENQIGDLPIPYFVSPENDEDHQLLANLGQEAHQLFEQKSGIISTYNHKASTIHHSQVSLSYYNDLLGQYTTDIEWQSSEPNREGHLLSLRIAPSVEGYILWGEVSEEEDWKEGDRQWIQLATVNIKLPHLRRYLLARLIYLTEFDPAFRRKQKLSREMGNLVNIAFEVLKVNVYDRDRFSNLRVLEVIEQRVQQEIGRSDLETILFRQTQIKQQIDRLAYRLYGVEDYIEAIEQALTLVL